MLARTPQPDDDFEAAPLAPRWHTALLVGFLLTVGVLGVILTMRGSAITATPPPSSRIAAIYVPTLFVEWGLTLYAVRIGRGKSALTELLGTRWATARRALEDLAIAFALLVFIEAAESIYASLSHASANAAVLALLPQNTVERFAWVVLACSVGFCEEVVYRGYLFEQLTAFTRSRWTGATLSAILFGLAHGQQGIATQVRFTVYGVVFALVAWKRKSLLPGIACHVAIDVSSGLLHH